MFSILGAVKISFGSSYLCKVAGYLMVKNNSEPTPESGTLEHSL